MANLEEQDIPAMAQVRQRETTPQAGDSAQRAQAVITRLRAWLRPWLRAWLRPWLRAWLRPWLRAWLPDWLGHWELWLALLLGGWLRLVALDRAPWLDDQTQLLDMARAAVLRGMIPASGIPTSIGTLNLPVTI